MIVSLNSRHRSHAGAFPQGRAHAAQAKSKKESRANRARRLSRSMIPKASAPRLLQKNRLRPKSQTPCPISQSSAHAQRVSLCRFLRSQPRRIGLGYRRTGRDPDTPSFTISQPTSRLPIQTGKARTQAGGDPLWKSEMRPKRDKTRDAVGRTSRESSLSDDPSAKFFWEKRGPAQKRRNRARTKELVSRQGTERRKRQTQKRNNAEYESCTSLIDLEGIGMIVIPASLRSDFTHIAGIRNQESFCFVSNK